MESQIGRQPRIVFVVGASRSGTTLLSNLLGNSPDIITLKETHYFQNIVGSPKDIIGRKQSVSVIAQLLNRLENGPWPHASNSKYTATAYEYAVHIYKNRCELSAYTLFYECLCVFYDKDSPAYFVEQTPANVFIMEDLKDQDCHIIQMIRDPRGVLMSQKQRHKKYFTNKKMGFRNFLKLYLNYSPLSVIRLWQRAYHMGTRVETEVHFSWVRFEGLLQNPEVILKGMFDELSLPFNSSYVFTDYQDSSHGDRHSSIGVRPEIADVWRRTITYNENNLVCWLLKLEMLEAQYLNVPREPGKMAKWMYVALWLKLLLKSPLVIIFNFDKLGFYIRSFKS